MSELTPEPAGQPTGASPDDAPNTGAPTVGDTTTDVPAVTDPTTPPPADVPTADPTATQPAAPDVPAAAGADDAPQLAPGDVIQHTYFDVYSGAGGEEVTVHGLVVETFDDEVDDGKGGTVTVPRARVAWLPNLSDPVNASELRPVE